MPTSKLFLSILFFKRAIVFLYIFILMTRNLLDFLRIRFVLNKSYIRNCAICHLFMTGIKIKIKLLLWFQHWSSICVRLSLTETFLLSPLTVSENSIISAIVICSNFFNSAMFIHWRNILSCIHYNLFEIA